MEWTQIFQLVTNAEEGKKKNINFKQFATQGKPKNQATHLFVNFTC